MKKVFILTLLLCFAMGLKAQVAKTINVTFAGSLSILLTTAEKSTITDLTLTGSIDARDFKTMRDNMPALTVLDLSEVVIHSHAGEGTETSGSYNYYADNVIPSYAFYEKPIKSIALPLSATKIASMAFADCNQLEELTLPQRIRFIGFKAFDYCNHIKSIHVNAFIPPDLNIPQAFPPSKETVFSTTTKSSCPVYVPYGTKALYAAAFGWKDFSVIEEASSGFNLDVTSVDFEGGQNSAAIRLAGNVNWKVVSDQSWLTVTPEAGTGSQTLTLTAAANTSIMHRSAMVTVLGEGIYTGQIMVTQEGLVKNITITAGNLRNTLSHEELKGISNLNIKGTMDARDFKILRDSIPLLSVLDISEVKIEACSIYYLPQDSSPYIYNANEIPRNAFEAWESQHQDLNLRSVILPHSITSIDQAAFSHCKLLESINIPASVTTIRPGAFQGCYSLKAVYVNSIHPIDLSNMEGWYVFDDNQTTCTLYVPYGAAPLYSQALEWRDFGQMIEGTEGFIVYPTKLLIGGDEGSVATAPVKSSIPLSITSDQEWLKVDSVMEAGYKTLTLMADANPLETVRKATVTFSATGYEPQTIEVIQYVASTTVDVVAGGLQSAIGNVKLSGITRLTITGTIDARDFKTLRDRMPGLRELDLSNVKIAAYSGSSGTDEYTSYYPEDEIPVNAFHRGYFEKPVPLITVTLPKSANSIGSGAFSSCTSLHSISVPPNIQKIGASAFAFCYNLSSATFPSSISTIPAGSFQGCISLTHFNIPETVTHIGGGAFEDCYLLDSITIPPGVISIGEMAFSRCYGLDSLLLPSSLTYLGKRAFGNCLNLTSINIPISLTEIQDDTFTSCNHLDSINIPASVTKIGKGAFTLCGAVNVDKENQFYTSTNGILFNKDQSVLMHVPVNTTGSYTIPSTVTTIDSKAFMNCSNITSVKTSSSITTIGDEAFCDCKMNAINLTSPLATLGRYAFANCSNLDSISIPSSIIKAGESVFYNCSGLKSIYMFSRIPGKYPLVIFPDAGIDEKHCILYVPYGSKNSYMQNEPWNKFKHIVEVPGFMVPPKLHIGYRQGSSLSIPITGNSSWTAHSDGSWLTVNTLSGNANQELILTADANPTYTVRIAHVTVSGHNIDPQTIAVWQYGIGTAVDELDNNDHSLTCYPNPFTAQMTLEIINPLHREINIEIYSISGQKIKTLVRAQKGAKISLLWRGDNEQGMQVPPGMYLVKVNEKTMKVVREGR